MSSDLSPLFTTPNTPKFRGGLKSQTKMEEKTVKKLMIEAFKVGKKTHKCEDDMMEFWVEERLNEERKNGY